MGVMQVSKNSFSRFDISKIHDPIGIAGYHGRLSNLIGKLLAIFHKTVALDTKAGTYYLNCISFAKWYQRVTGIQGDTNFFALQARNPIWVKNKIKEVIQENQKRTAEKAKEQRRIDEDKAKEQHRIDEAKAKEQLRIDDEKAKVQLNDHFVQAVRNGDFQECQNLFKKGVDVKTLPNRDELLHLAFQNKLKGDRFKVCEFLIEHGADINKRDAEDVLLLEKTIEERDAKAMIWLMKHGVNVTLQPSPKIKYRTFAYHIEKMQWDNAEEKSAFKSLVDAQNHIEALEKLLEKKNKIFLNAIEARNINKCKEYIELGFDLNPKIENQGTPLNRAIYVAAQFKGQQDRFELCQLLIDKGANVNGEGFDGARPLAFAVERADTEMVLWLIDKGATLDFKPYKDCDWFEYARYSTWRQNMAEEERRDILMFFAPGEDKAKYVEEIFKQEKLEVEFRYLLVNKERRDLEKLKKIIDDGLDVSKPPLESKAIGTSSFLSKFYNLLPNKIDDQAMEILEFLLSKGARALIDEKDIYGSTLLVHAIRFNHQANFVELLVKHGADTKLLTKDGKTYLELAKSLKRDEDDQEWDRNQQAILAILEQPEKILKV